MAITVEKFKHPDGNYTGFFIRLDRETSLKLIQSLLEQINSNNPNYNRIEFINCFSKDSNVPKLNYLTICVDPEKPKRRNHDR